MTNEEQNTIDAINKLKGEYPYAASMLVYVVIERQVKQYLIESANDSSLLDHIPVKYKKKIHNTKLIELNLGQLEKFWNDISMFIYPQKPKMPVRSRPSTCRQKN